MHAVRMPTGFPEGSSEEPGAIEYERGYPSQYQSAWRGVRVADVMTDNVEVVSPDDTLFEVAEKMRRLNVGAMPVCDGRRLIGMVTDRDMVVRGIAESRDPEETSAADVMSAPIIYCFEDESVEAAAEMMEQRKIRRVIVLDRNKKMVGIASLGDLAVKLGQEHLAGGILGRVSQPVRGKAA